MARVLLERPQVTQTRSESALPQNIDTYGLLKGKDLKLGLSSWHGYKPDHGGTFLVIDVFSETVFGICGSARWTDQGCLWSRGLPMVAQSPALEGWWGSALCPLKPVFGSNQIQRKGKFSVGGTPDTCLHLRTASQCSSPFSPHDSQIVRSSVR
jgi:hypothetical protein